MEDENIAPSPSVSQEALSLLNGEADCTGGIILVSPSCGLMKNVVFLF